MILHVFNTIYKKQYGYFTRIFKYSIPVLHTDECSRSWKVALPWEQHKEGLLINYHPVLHQLNLLQTWVFLVGYELENLRNLLSWYARKSFLILRFLLGGTLFGRDSSLKLLPKIPPLIYFEEVYESKWILSKHFYFSRLCSKYI